MDGMLSQDEINALLNGMSLNGSESEDAPVETESPDASAAVSSADSMPEEKKLTPAEIDALGEVANISMGTAATTLSALLNQKVTITTPNVSYATWNEVAEQYVKPCVLLKISYVEGLTGDNVLVLQEDDVKIITNLMMGAPGVVTDEPLGELHLSAIGEAMNQMMGSASTSMSSMLSKKIDISPPVADLVDLKDGSELESLFDTYFVKISFQMEIGDLINSQIMQLYPIDFAKNLYQQFMGSMDTGSSGASEPAPTPQQAATAPAPAPQPPMGYGQPPMGYEQPPMGYGQPPMGYGQPPFGYGQQPMGYGQPQGQPVNVAPATFSAFSGDYTAGGQRENIDLIIDVPLEVTVELGRTHKSIKEILEFAPGAILELNKIAGEPVDVLVNGKNVAKGEVVVIEESFGVRISEIIK